MPESITKKNFLRFCVNPVPIWTTINNVNGTIHLNAGICKQVFDVIASKMKFGYEFVVPADHQWGNKLPNGSFTGMIGLLQREEADVCIGPSSPSYARSEVVDFSNLYSMQSLAIIAADTEGPSGNVFSCILNFDWIIWVVLIMALVVVAFFYTIGNISHEDIPISHSFCPIMLENIWTYLAALCLQGKAFMPTSISGRILVGIWWFSVIIVMNSFSGGLKAAMMAKSLPARINTVQDIVDRPYLRPLTLKGTIYEDFIREAPQEVFKKLWKQIVKHNSLISPSQLMSLETIKEVKEGKSVLIMDNTFARVAVGRSCATLGKSTFYFSKETMFPHSFGMMFRKSLPKKLKKRINKVIRHVFEAGLMKNWWKELDYSFEKCSKFNPVEKEEPLYVDDVKGVFLIYSILLGVSLVYLLFERLLRQKEKSSTIRILKMNRIK